ncbi:hypothetical protein B0H11DRAFT_2316443 [Mycena galericulata]|nr:hypothetical protein B0H11DRAFT_2316443 [Mycena galericulata]
MMKTEAEETGPPTGGDPYVSAAATLDQAQRSLSIAQAQLKTPTISVAVAEQRLDALRSEIVALKALVEKDRVEIEGLRKGAADATQARDLARSEAEERIRVAVKAPARAEEGAALSKERELLNTQRTAFEAEKKALVDDRTQFAQRLQNMSQQFRPNPLPETPQAATLPPAGTSRPDADPKPSMGYHILFARQAVIDEFDKDSANSRKRRRTSDSGSSFVPTLQPPHPQSTEPKSISAHTAYTRK